MMKYQFIGCQQKYTKVKCMASNRVVFHTQLANNRNRNSYVFIGKTIDWSNYKQSLNE